MPGEAVTTPVVIRQCPHMVSLGVLQPYKTERGLEMKVGEMVIPTCVRVRPLPLLITLIEGLHSKQPCPYPSP